MPLIRTFLSKKDEAMSITATSAVQGILRLLKFDPAMFAAFDVWDRESRSVVRGCEAVAIQGSRLVVRVPSVLHRQEILYSKQRLLSRINQALGKKIITDIQFELSENRQGDIREQSKNRFGQPGR
jgi:hypothetical protein